jgi:hypothetical protein
MPRRLAPGQVVRAGELQRRLDRLAPTGHRIDERVVERQHLGQLVAVGLEHLGRELRPVYVVDPPGLLRQRRDDRRISVPDVHDDRAPGRVQIPLAGSVLDPGPLAPNGRRQFQRRPREHVAHAYRP